MDVPTPVELIEFSAHQLTDDSIELSWQTAQEINNNGFEIERSTNGSSFTAIAFVNGAGNSSAGRSYSFNDLNPPDGLLFYRLKQIDFDGAFELLKTVSITSAPKRQNILVYPTITSGDFYIDSTLETYEIQLIDVYGNAIKVEKDTVNSKIKALPPGKYVILFLLRDGTMEKQLFVKY